MPTALSADAFVDLVQRSRLMSADQMQQVLRELSEEGTEVDGPQALAAALVGRGLLTSWQVGFLLKGKHNGFFLGSYRFLKMLGKGGMGAVYLAEHERMRRRCAIKVLPTKLISESSSVLERFYLEAQAVAALDDPNIVRAYDVNMEVQGTREIHYLVMEYVEGSDLQVKVEKEGLPDYVQVADFARQAASGLAHAHENGLIHRDIKPANLLIDDKGTVKILDLGLARFFDDRLEASLTTTHNESILGTADYLSPEQALDSHNVDTRTDIYSLGCTCYFMLTGQPPFPEGSVAQRLMSHQVKSPKAVEKLRPDVPVDLVTIVEKMIAKSPDDRYQTAGEVGDAFAAWLATHADDEWKETHREIVDGAPSQARREPTRAKSAATEDTDLELGFAPMDDEPAAEISPPTGESNRAAPTTTGGEPDLGLAQLEELQPAANSFDANSFDANSSSGGFDDLLNEALDNYPALDSNPQLGAVSPLQAPVGSGIRRAPKAAPNQQLKLILIGLAVGIPLAALILFVAIQFFTSDEPQLPVVDAGAPTGQVRQPDAEPVGEPPQTKTPAAPVADNTEPDRTGNPPPAAATNIVEPAAPTPATTVPDEGQPPKSEPITPRTPSPDGQGTPPAATPSSPKSDPVKSDPVKSDPPRTQPAGVDPQGQGQSEPKKPEPKRSSPEEIKKNLLAGLSEVTIKLDRGVKNNNPYDLMVLRTAQETVTRAGLKASFESQGASPAVLTLSFEAGNAGADIVFTVGAELKCRDDDSKEVSVWKTSTALKPMRRSELGGAPPKVLRDRVSDVYKPLVREYKQAAAAAKQP